MGCFVVSPGFGQTAAQQKTEHTIAIQIPTVSLVSVVGGNQVQLKLDKPQEAGQAISSFTADSSFWLNYSFVKGSSARPFNHVYAKVENGAIPDGTTLSVYAKTYQGTGHGSFGTPTGEVVLTTQETKVIENISSCYTGTGLGNGHQLVYQLKLLPQAYHSLSTAQSQQLSVVYTISD